MPGTPPSNSIVAMTGEREHRAETHAPAQSTLRWIAAGSLALGVMVGISSNGGTEAIRDFVVNDVLSAFAILFSSGLPFCS